MWGNPLSTRTWVEGVNEVITLLLVFSINLKVTEVKTFIQSCISLQRSVEVPTQSSSSNIIPAQITPGKSD